MVPWPRTRSTCRRNTKILIEILTLKRIAVRSAVVVEKKGNTEKEEVRSAPIKEIFEPRVIEDDSSTTRIKLLFGARVIARKTRVVIVSAASTYRFFENTTKRP